MKSTCVLVLLIVPLSWISTQPLNFRQLTVNDGLTQNSVSCIDFDKDGFAWFATADGLNRYDGYNFLQFRKGVGLGKQMQNTGITQVICDRYNQVWFTGENGCEILNTLNNRIKVLLNENFTYNMSSMFYDTVHQKIYLFVEKKGIWKCDVKTHQVQQIVNGSNPCCSDFYSLNFILQGDDLYFASRGKTWLKKINLKNYSCQEEKLVAGTDVKVFSSWCQSPEGNLFFCILSSKMVLLVEYDLDTRKILRSKQIHTSTGDPFYKACTFINSGQTILVSDYFQGLLFFDLNFSEKAQYPNQTILSSITTGANYLSIKEKNNCLWISCDPHGVTYCNLEQAGFAHIINKSSKVLPIVKGIFTDKKQNIYSCLLNEGIQVFDKNGNYLHDLAKIGQGNRVIDFQGFNTVQAINDHQVFIHCYNFLGFYDTKTGVTKNFVIPYLKANGVDLKSTKDYFHTGCRWLDNTYVVGYTRTIWHANLTGSMGQWTKVDTVPNEITSLYVTKGKNVWIGTTHGLYTLESGRKKSILNLQGYFIKKIFQEEDNSMWIATTNGVWHLDTNGSKIEYLTTENGLPNNFIYGILQDEKYLWFSTNYGLSRYDLANKTFSNYTASDGLQSNEFNSGAFWKSTSGNLYFGGVNGITMIQKENIHPQRQITSKIVRLNINERIWKDSIPIWKSKKLSVPYDQNTFEFEVTGNEPALNAQLTYRYKLKGIDRYWTSPTKNRVIKYARVPPGDYLFQVMCGVGNAWEEGPIQSIYLHITPPFWQTWWFQLSGIAICLIIVGLIFHWYNKRKYHQELEKLKIQQQLEEERIRISRDLHDNMGAYTLALMQNVENLEATNKNTSIIQHMQDNSRHILQSLRETIWVLNNKSLTLKEFSSEFKNYCFNVLRNFEQLQLEVSEDITDHRVISSTTIIQLNKILQEAVQNIVKHVGKGSIHFFISDRKKMMIRISDQGPGFHVQSQQFGNGLKNMKWRAEQVGFSFEISSSLSGTTITLQEC